MHGQWEIDGETVSCNIWCLGVQLSVVQTCQWTGKFLHVVFMSWCNYESWTNCHTFYSLKYIMCEVTYNRSQLKVDYTQFNYSTISFIQF